MEEVRLADGDVRWGAGSLVAQENYYAGHLITIFPVRVVRDSPELLALYTAAGSTLVDGSMRERQSMALQDRMTVYLDPDPQPLGERPARTHVLTLNTPDSYRSTWLMWTRAWEFMFWYVNLELPYERTATGITHGRSNRGDLILDLVVAPDFSWAWKDRDEFDAACEVGLLSDSERRLALDESKRAIACIDQRGWPFNEPWPEWRPDPTWPTPHLRLGDGRTWDFAPPNEEPQERT